MTEKQQHLLKLFREIDEICKRHKIEYVMAGGTLIGVMRNHGFIPWDDDIDLMLTRDNWDKFVEACKTELPPGRSLQSAELDRRYTNSFARYTDADTTAIHKHQIVSDDVAGEIVDMLVLDPIPDDDRLYEKYRSDLMVYAEIINPTATFVRRFDISPWKYVRYKLLTKLAGTDRVLARLEKRMFSYRDVDCSRYAMRWGGCPFLFDREMLFPAKFMDFEGTPVMVPNHISDYLVWHYGDEWSYIPPHAMRESHETVSNLHLSYEVLRRDYMPKLDKKKVLYKATVRKLGGMFHDKGYRKNLADANRMHAGITKLSLERAVMDEGTDLDGWMENREFGKLEEFFEDYYRVQLSTQMIGRADHENIYSFDHPMLVELDDHVFFAALYTLFSREKAGMAKRLLDLREKKEPLSGELERLKNWILDLRKAADCYELGDPACARELAEGVLGQVPEHVGASKFKVRLMMEEAERIGEPKEAAEYLKHCLGLWPEDGYFIRYQGDLAWKDERYSEALLLYQEAIENTQNGTTHLEIRERLRSAVGVEKKVLEQRMNRGKCEETLETACLWGGLLPEEPLFAEYALRARLEMAGGEKELEELAKDLEKQRSMYPECQAWQELMIKTGEKLGYTSGLAEVYAGIAAAETGQEAKSLWKLLEAAAEEDKGENPAQAEQLRGEIFWLEGRTKEAFGAYENCVRLQGESYAQRIAAGKILRDLYEGERFFKKCRGTSQDNAGFLAGWLDKYGSIENLRELMPELLAR